MMTYETVLLVSNIIISKVLIGWMSNWRYADRIPTATGDDDGWRGEMTIPR